MKKNRQAGFATRAIHDGQQPDPLTGSVTVPIYPTSTYVQQGIRENKGYEYSRVSNPTRTRLEENLASLEGGVAAPVFASGMAAINAVASMLKSGDHVVCGNDLYGGTPRLFNQVLTGFGLEFSYVDTSDAENVEHAIRRNTRMVYVETPTNPLMRLSDLAAISRICRRKKAELVVDNTFMSPYFQQPLALGADMVLHSTTKFLNGHSDGLGGVVVCSTPEQAEKLAFLQKAAGAILSPFECWLVLRGVKTLAARMEIHDRNGRVVVQSNHAPMLLAGSTLTMAEAVKAMAKRPVAPGDLLIANDPYRGGQHLMDVAMLAPVFRDGDLVGYVGAVAHHSDLGGASPGGVAGGWATGAATAGLTTAGTVVAPAAVGVWGCRRPPAAPAPDCDLSGGRRWRRRVASCEAPAATATWTPGLIG